MSDDVSHWHAVNGAEQAVITAVMDFRQHCKEHPSCEGLPPNIEAACQKLEAARAAWLNVCRWCAHEHDGICQADADNGGHPGAICGCAGICCMCDRPIEEGQVWATDSASGARMHQGCRP